MIALDLDNVIAATDPKIREIIGTLSGTHLSQTDITVFEYAKALEAKGVDPAEAREIETEALRIFHEGECLNVEIVPGATWGISQLQCTGPGVVIVTSRPKECAKLTVSWLRRKGIRYSRLIHAKSKAAVSAGWLALVEDAEHYAKEVSEMGIPVCVLD